jgi:hypothetical protein
MFAASSKRCFLSRQISSVKMALLSKRRTFKDDRRVWLFTKGKQDGGSADSQTTPGGDIGATHVADNAGKVRIRVDDGVLCPDVLLCGRHDLQDVRGVDEGRGENEEKERTDR